MRKMTCEQTAVFHESLDPLLTLLFLSLSGYFMVWVVEFAALPDFVLAS
jgi:hypothetical protein